MKLSIIIPVYNCEKYLEECIESIIKQNLEDFEIILVDDGSIDKSSKICDEYEKNYEYIKAIHKENGGASSARNVGVKLAKGEYIMFVDSDDFLNSEIVLKEIIKNLHTDIIQYKYMFYYTEPNKYVHLTDITINQNENYKESLQTRVKEGTLSISPCDKIVKKSVLTDNNIVFKEGICAEDIDWSLALYMCAKTIEYTNYEIYVYRQQREGSVSSVPTKKSVDSLVFIMEKWINYNYNDEYFKNLYYNYLAYQYVILITILSKKICNKETKRKIYEYKFILKYNNNAKVKLSNKLFKIFGIKLGVKVLKSYIYLKNKGLVKI